LTGGTLTDAAGNSSTLTIPAGFNIADLKNIVIDTTAPTVSTIDLPGGGTGSYITGNTIYFGINFSETLASFGTDSTLWLTFTSGDVYASYDSYAAGIITYSYLILGTDQDDIGGIVLNSIILRSNTIQDAAGNDATLTLPGSVNTIQINP
jgi:hypothetical protein